MIHGKKAQEFSMWGTVYAVVGVVLSFIMARSMEANWFWLLLTVIVTAVVCYMIGWKASGE